MLRVGLPHLHHLRAPHRHRRQRSGLIAEQNSPRPRQRTHQHRLVDRRRQPRPHIHLGQRRRRLDDAPLQRPHPLRPPPRCKSPPPSCATPTPPASPRPRWTRPTPATPPRRPWHATRRPATTSPPPPPAATPGREAHLLVPDQRPPTPLDIHLITRRRHLVAVRVRTHRRGLVATPPTVGHRRDLPTPTEAGLITVAGVRVTTTSDRPLMAGPAAPPRRRRVDTDVVKLQHVEIPAPMPTRPHLNRQRNRQRLILGQARSYPAPAPASGLAPTSHPTAGWSAAGQTTSPPPAARPHRRTHHPHG